LRRPGLLHEKSQAADCHRVDSRYYTLEASLAEESSESPETALPQLPQSLAQVPFQQIFVISAAKEAVINIVARYAKAFLFDFMSLYFRFIRRVGHISRRFEIAA
jgi:hypothetical protein